MSPVKWENLDANPYQAARQATPRPGRYCVRVSSKQRSRGARARETITVAHKYVRYSQLREQSSSSSSAMRQGRRLT